MKLKYSNLVVINVLEPIVNHLQFGFIMIIMVYYWKIWLHESEQLTISICNRVLHVLCVDNAHSRLVKPKWFHQFGNPAPRFCAAKLRRKPKRAQPHFLGSKGMNIGDSSQNIGNLLGCA